MTIKPTCIGAFPKPDYIGATNWSESGEQVDGESAARQFSYANSTSTPDTSDLFDRATQDAIADQVAWGTETRELYSLSLGRMRDALQHIDSHRLIAAPDCGLIMLERDVAMKKLANLSAAARATS